MKYFVGLFLVLTGFSACAQPQPSLLDQRVNPDLESALADVDSLMQMDSVALDVFTQMALRIAMEEASDMTYRELRTEARQVVQHAEDNAERMENGLDIQNEELVYLGQDEEMARFDLFFRVTNKLDVPVEDFSLMVATYRPDGTDDWGSTGGEGYLEGEPLAPGASRRLVFPIELNFYEDDEPDGEYGTYAIIRHLKAGGISAAELILYDIQTDRGWMKYPR